MGSVKPIVEQILPTRLRLLATITGCFFAVVGFLLYGWLFLILPSLLVSGAVVQPSFPRLGRWLLAVGACIVTVYAAFLAVSAIGHIRSLHYHHDIQDIAILILSLSSVALVFWCDVALIVNARRVSAGDKTFPRPTS